MTLSARRYSAQDPLPGASARAFGLVWPASAALLVVVGLVLLWRHQAPLHEDEAIYASWGLALRHDWWLSHTAVDKPPLLFYLLAASLAVLGPTELAARLPNLFVTLVAAVFVARLVARRRDRAAAAGAGLLFLAAPLTQVYAAGAFTDPLMLALTLAAAERAQAGRPRASGLLLGLALLAKPTSLFLAPLVVALLLREGRSGAGALRRFLLATAALLLASWAWDVARYAPSWWLLGERAYGSLGRPAIEVREWARVAVLGLGPVVGCWILEVGLWSGDRGARIGDLRKLGAAGPARRVWTAIRDRVPADDLSEGILWATVLLFLPLHILLGFRPWDRYLLPLAALLAVGAGWRLARPSRAALVAALLALPIVAWTAAGGSGLGGRDGRWIGIETLGARVKALPAGVTVLYTDLGRPLAFYAHGAQATLRWAPDAGALGELAAGAPGPVLIAARAATLPAACAPTRPSESPGASTFVLVPATGACQAALVP